MGTAPGAFEDFEDAGDNELIEAVRGGSGEAYGVLYQRHVSAAHNMARQLTGSSAEADDLVSEAFAKVLTGLRSGQGPNTAFRAYLLTTIRRTAYDRTRKDRKLQYSDDISAEENPDLRVPFTDTAVAGLERSLATQAFNRIPERWQTVLWHLEVEGQSPAEVAPLLGLTPNGVSALAYRAREGLRQAYLQVHLGNLENSGQDLERCRATVERLGAWTRKGLSKRETAQVDNHLDSCDRCTALAEELGDINGGLRLVVAPFLLGAGAAGYLAGKSGGAAAAAGAGAAGGAAGAASAASSLPRQLAGTVASTVALVVAVAVGLAAGGQQSTPSAAQPPPEKTTPAPPEPSEPAPEEPDRPPSPSSPPPEPPPQPAEPDRSPPPAPEEPDLVASGPGEPIRLVAGGDPATLPIELRNNGAAVSDPITAEFSLPEGITATLPSDSPAERADPEPASSEPASTGPAWVTTDSTTTAAAAAEQREPQFDCTRADAVLTCTTNRGLRPGETMKPSFSLRAGEDARNGEIGVDLTTAGGMSLSLADVRVHVAPDDEPGVRVTARSWSGVPWLASRVHASVRNTGDTTGPARLSFELPEGIRPMHLPEGCEHVESKVRCTEELSPGQRTEFAVWLRDARWFSLRTPTPEDLPSTPAVEWTKPTRMSVTATLDLARDSELVKLESWCSRLPDHWDFPDSWDLPGEHSPDTGQGPSSETRRPNEDRPRETPEPPRAPESAPERTPESTPERTPESTAERTPESGSDSAEQRPAPGTTGQDSPASTDPSPGDDGGAEHRGKQQDAPQETATHQRREATPSGEPESEQEDRGTGGTDPLSRWMDENRLTGLLGQ
ncbi:sigma-70 family RNA polymerase sigma factor [Actinopolyspora saharensis]|uniref:RNA polymerase sigma factor, sigma-70 family n=1 Tax=Actinopolyspora saharensis TaxID=995062 RepID=A0A1H1EC52_9ACTN|nr:sigma-70 family RNA polymerase sigma factor [Actinopolyspora saharensis]SDQ86337.1 RNA polymerase sigma factor, sigma-70 family [Actinopolyspora saharensis]